MSEPLWESCSACRAHALEPNLVGALASVGIEHGKTVPQMARSHFASYHASHD